MNALLDAVRAIDVGAYGDDGVSRDHAVLTMVDVRQLLLSMHRVMQRSGYAGRATPLAMATEQPLTVYDADAIVCEPHAAQCVPVNADLALLVFTKDAYGEPCAVVVHAPNEWRDPLVVRVPILAPAKLFEGTFIVCAVHTEQRQASTPETAGPLVAASAAAAQSVAVECASSDNTPRVVVRCLDAVLVAGKCMHKQGGNTDRGMLQSWNCQGFLDRHAVLSTVVDSIRSAHVDTLYVECVPYTHPQEAAIGDANAVHIVPLASRACHYVTGHPTRSVWRAEHRVRVTLTAKWMGKNHTTLPCGARGVFVNKPRTGGAGTRMAVAAYTRGDSVYNPWCITGHATASVYGQTCDVAITLSPALETALTNLTKNVKKHARSGGGSAEKLACLPDPWFRGDSATVDTTLWALPMCAEAVCSVRIVRKGGVDVVHLTPLVVAPRSRDVQSTDTRHAVQAALSTAYDSPSVDAVKVVCDQAMGW